VEWGGGRGRETPSAHRKENGILLSKAYRGEKSRRRGVWKTHVGFPLGEEKKDGETPGARAFRAEKEKLQTGGKRAKEIALP